MQRIRNSKGKPVLLSRRERALANVLQRQHSAMKNALGFEINITTLTTIMKQVTEQKFFRIRPSEYMPVQVGNGAWSTNILTYVSFILGDDFETGNVNTGTNNGRLAMADAGVTGVTNYVINWAKGVTWTLMELNQAAKAGNWDLITAKEMARKENWDLGIQKIAFLGSDQNASVLGLFTQAGVTVNTTTIVQPLSTLSTVDLRAFCTTVLNDYRANCNRTAWPALFIIPESDYLGLAAPASADFPIKSTLQVLQETFAIMTGNKDFKILPCAYGDDTYSGQTYQQYCLHSNDPRSGRMDIPVDYTNTLANSLDNFSFQNAGYGQYTGYLQYRAPEMLYYRFTP